jgi:hypothetical protein
MFGLFLQKHRRVGSRQTFDGKSVRWDVPTTNVVSGNDTPLALLAEFRGSAAGTEVIGPPQGLRTVLHSFTVELPMKRLVARQGR